jgi:methylenetetrahydrofolate reductase (NADPH)
MHAAFDKTSTPEDAYSLSIELARKQAEELIAEGVDHLHLYTLNNPNLSYDICAALGYREIPARVAEGGAA